MLLRASQSSSVWPAVADAAPPASLPCCLQKKQEQRAAAEALDMVLFKEAKKKNELRKAAEMACLAKKPKEKEPEKRDIHVDSREQKEQDRAPRLWAR